MTEGKFGTESLGNVFDGYAGKQVRTRELIGGKVNVVLIFLHVSGRKQSTGDDGDLFSTFVVNLLHDFMPIACMFFCAARLSHNLHHFSKRSA